MALQGGGERLIEQHESINRDLAELRGDGWRYAPETNGFVERSYEFSFNFDRVHAPQAAGDEMSGETVSVEEAEAMDLSAVDTDIDVEALVRIVDGIGLFGVIEFSALTAKDILTTEFINLQAAYDYYNEYSRIKGFSVRRLKVGRRTKQGGG
ncbi:FAR1 DNA-binding domain protein [Arachis hypogaea]|nr:FAR1 DNA-binding domain protein [Arachis hypogaea]